MFGHTQTRNAEEERKLLKTYVSSIPYVHATRPTVLPRQVVRPSICPSDCPSVTLTYCDNI